MQGCMPNLVTFNTLCDIYGKTGRWADALAVLDTLQEQVRFGRWYFVLCLASLWAG